MRPPPRSHPPRHLGGYALLTGNTDRPARGGLPAMPGLRNGARPSSPQRLGRRRRQSKFLGLVSFGNAAARMSEFRKRLQRSRLFIESRQLPAPSSVGAACPGRSYGAGGILGGAVAINRSARRAWPSVLLTGFADPFNLVRVFNGSLLRVPWRPSRMNSRRQLSCPAFRATVRALRPKRGVNHD